MMPRLVKDLKGQWHGISMAFYHSGFFVNGTGTGFSFFILKVTTNMNMIKSGLPFFTFPASARTPTLTPTLKQ